MTSDTCDYETFVKFVYGAGSAALVATFLLGFQVARLKTGPAQVQVRRDALVNGLFNMLVAILVVFVAAAEFLFRPPSPGLGDRTPSSAKPMASQERANWIRANAGPISSPPATARDPVREERSDKPANATFAGEARGRR